MATRKNTPRIRAKSAGQDDAPIDARAFARLRDNPGQSYNWYIGTAAELLAAGVIQSYMLERPFNASKTLSLHDDIGVRVIIRQCADGRLRVIKSLGGYQRTAKTVEATVGKAVRDLLSRFARPPAVRS